MTLNTWMSTGRAETSRRVKDGGGVAGVLDMLLHLADLNAREVKIPYARGRMAGHTQVTAAMLEEQEWAAFKARLERRKLLLGAVGAHVVGGVLGGAGDADVNADGYAGDAPGDDTSGLEEDDVDMLLSLIGALEKGREAHRALTVSEIVKDLQGDKILSLEFPASARMQAQRMLARLRSMNRVWVDPKGRWALL